MTIWQTTCTCFVLTVLKVKKINKQTNKQTVPLKLGQRMCSAWEEICRPTQSEVSCWAWENTVESKCNATWLWYLQCNTWKYQNWCFFLFFLFEKKSMCECLFSIFIGQKPVFVRFFWTLHVVVSWSGGLRRGRPCVYLCLNNSHYAVEAQRRFRTEAVQSSRQQHVNLRLNHARKPFFSF